MKHCNEWSKNKSYQINKIEFKAILYSYQIRYKQYFIAFRYFMQKNPFSIPDNVFEI